MNGYGFVRKTDTGDVYQFNVIHQHDSDIVFLIVTYIFFISKKSINLNM